MNKQSILKTPFWVTSLFTIMTLALAACQPAGTAPSYSYGYGAAPANTMPAATAMPQPTVAAAMPAGVTVSMVADAKLGNILVDGNGMTLYAYSKDQPDQSNCTGNCATNWPPLISSGAPQAGTGVDPSLLGTAKLADGSMVVTYNKMPLYTWAKDMKAGDTTGQGVGTVWHVVSPQGMAVGLEPLIPMTGESAVAINVATDPTLGKILVDGKGMTLYMYTPDGPNQSTCTGGCLKAWPAFLTTGSVTAGTGVDASLIGTAKLADGSNIVTYNKMPLYFWMKDSKPGDATGQGVGSVWYVVSPDGKPVGK